MSSIQPFPSPSSSPGAGNGNNSGGGGGGMSLANSASLYLYTFLATLVLLLSVSGAIVIRSFVLRRRHRRMIEEAMRNGTWVPPTPPGRQARVDLSKKPELWEAYLGGGGWPAGGLGHESRKELGLCPNWKFEYSKDWESIKPICADHPASLSAPPYSDPTPDPTSLTPPSTLARARMFLNPPMPTPPLPPSSDNGSNIHSTNISVTELSSNSPTRVRVTVLIAMPSASSHGPSSASLASSLSSQPQLTTSHPLQLSCPRPKATIDGPLPHLEMGVAAVIIGPSEKSST